MKVDGIEAGAQVAALLLVPGEWRPVVAEVVGKRCHVVGRVGEPQHVVLNEFLGCCISELARIGVGVDDGQLFDDVQSKVSSLDFLTSNIVEPRLFITQT